MISIIVPVFNTEPLYIDECIISIRTFFDQNNDFEYELIIVNDGSTNKLTLDFLNSLVLRDNWILIHQKNKGLSAARNTGIFKAKGEFILPLDSDDKLHEDFYKVIMDIYKYSKADIYYGNAQHFGDENCVFKAKENLTKLDFILNGNQINATAVFKKSVWRRVGGYDENLKTYEDWDFWLRCKFSNINFKYIPTCIFYYRKIYDGKSMLQTTKNIAEDQKKIIFEKITLNKIDKSDVLDYIVNSFRRKKIKFLYFYLFIYFNNFFQLFFKNKKIL